MPSPNRQRRQRRVPVRAATISQTSPITPESTGSPGPGGNVQVFLQPELEHQLLITADSARNAQIPSHKSATHPVATQVSRGAKFPPHTLMINDQQVRHIFTERIVDLFDHPIELLQLDLPGSKLFSLYGSTKAHR